MMTGHVRGGVAMRFIIVTQFLLVGNSDFYDYEKKHV